MSYSETGNETGKLPPVKEGDVLDVQILSVGSKGDGVTKKDGFVIFVPGTAEGDNVKIKITKVLSNLALSEVVPDSVSSSSDDVKPDDSTSEDSETFGE